MNQRDDIYRAAACDHPQYIPCDIPCDPDWLNDQNPELITQIRELKKPLEHFVGGLIREEPASNAVRTSQESNHWYDIWDTEWEDDGYGAKTCGYPLEQGYDQLRDYSFPDSPYASIRYRIKPGCTREDVYMRGGVWFTLFERLWMLRGFTNMLTDPYLYPDEFVNLRDRVVEFNLHRIHQQLAMGVDGMYFSDDWGSQRGMLMKPDDWRRYFKPAYRIMFQPIRDAGVQVWYHSCGNVTEILDDLIDVGVNVLNPVQPQAMDVDALARQYGGRICFYGGVDVQGTMVHGRPSDVQAEAYHLAEIFGKGNGGYILSTSHSVMPETPLENVIALYETALDIGGTARIST